MPPYDGSGVFNVYTPGTPFVTGTTISSTVANNVNSDFATGLSTAITKDGQTTPTANIPMGGFKLTGLAAGTAAGDSLRYEQQFSVGANIASAATINLATATGQLIHVTGTTTITAVTLTAGVWRQVIFDGILTLTHHATDNNLPGGANITTAANDRALYWSDGTTVYCIAYIKASGKSVINPAIGDITGLGTGVATALAINVGSTGAVTTQATTMQVFTANDTWTKPANVRRLKITVVGSGGGGGGSGPGATSAGSGGSAGGTAIINIAASSAGATETVTVGAAGTASSAGSSVGGNGNVSSFGTLCVAGGGLGGNFGANNGSAQGVSGGIGTTGGVLIGGGDSQGGSAVTSSYALGGAGGSSSMGGGALGGHSGNAGNTGRPYGGGGGGGSVTGGSTTAGGAGAAGIVIVEEFY